MFCTKCGKQLQEDAKFCNNCGSVLKIAKEIKSMQKWEYEFYSPDIHYNTKGFLSTEIRGAQVLWTKKNEKGLDACDIISEFGTKGWELVSVTPISNGTYDNTSGTTSELLFVFKRPIE
ncbi:MAG: zinc-ribbon domain-containing protein [Saccharofermentanales bacterium]